MTDLDKLAERCENASGPHRKLNLEIAQALGIGLGGRKPFTHSLDAAASLVPDDHYWSLDNRNCAIVSQGLGKGVPQFSPLDLNAKQATTPALALCAASLRALSIMKVGNTGETGRISTDGEGAR